MTEESCGARALYRILDVLGTGAALCAVPLWKLGYQFLHFGLRPGSDRARTHVSLRTERKRELGDVVPVRSVDNDQEIVVAGGHIDLLDFNSHFLGQIASGLGALGSILDRADPLVRPVQRADEHGHAVLRAVIRKDRRPRRGGGRPVECERVRRRKKRAISRETCPPTASALPRTKDFGTVPLAARGSDYSGGGVCERGECAMLLDGALEPRVMQMRNTARGGISDLERTSPAYRSPAALRRHVEVACG